MTTIGPSVPTPWIQSVSWLTQSSMTKIKSQMITSREALWTAKPWLRLSPRTAANPLPWGLHSHVVPTLSRLLLLREVDAHLCPSVNKQGLRTKSLKLSQILRQILGLIDKVKGKIVSCSKRLRKTLMRYLKLILITSDTKSLIICLRIRKNPVLTTMIWLTTLLSLSRILKRKKWPLNAWLVEFPPTLSPLKG